MSAGTIGGLVAAYAALTTLEIVLGIDNIVFISAVTARLPEISRPKAQRTGLALALVGRLALLVGISWIMTLTKPLASVWGRELSVQDVLLMGGGLFLMVKATREIYKKAECVEVEQGTSSASSLFANVIAQILVMDLIFSLDSIITAVGMTRNIPIIAAAMVTAVGVMMVFAAAVSGFIERHPSVKLLALAFLLLVGVLLFAEGLGQHIPRGYIYFAMAFSLGVELIEMRYERNVASRGDRADGAMDEGGA